MITVSPKLMDKEAWLQALGFCYSPFDHPAADRPPDRHLSEYAIPFPYFDDLKTPGSHIVVACEGHGKSAYRIELAHTLKDRTSKSNLVLNYTDFTRALAISSPESHCDEILRLALRTLLIALGDRLTKKRGDLSVIAQSYLDWLVSNYADLSFIAKDTDRSEELILAENRRRLHLLKLRKAREGYSTPPEVVSEIEDLTAMIGLQELGVEPGNIAAVPLLLSVSEKLERLETVLDGLGFDETFVLVEPDPPPNGPWTIETQGEAMRPLVSYLGFQNHLQLKLFLPLELLSVLKHRRGRPLERDWEVKKLEWSRDNLDEMLQARLSVAGYHSFNDLVFSAGPRSNMHDRIIEAADSSPRELVRLCRFIFSEHVKRPTSQVFFTEQEIEASLDNYHKLHISSL